MDNSVKIFVFTAATLVFLTKRKDDSRKNNIILKLANKLKHFWSKINSHRKNDIAEGYKILLNIDLKIISDHKNNLLEP